MSKCAQYYHRDGTPYRDVLEWAADFERQGKKRVAETTLSNGKWVSTVWLGLCHTFHGLNGEDDGQHLIFETMVFPSKAGPLTELDQQRYATEAEALAGHEEMVGKWSLIAGETDDADLRVICPYCKKDITECEPGENVLHIGRKCPDAR